MASHAQAQTKSRRSPVAIKTKTPTKPASSDVGTVHDETEVRSDFHGLPTANNSLWNRYFQGAEEAFQKNDMEKGKKYLFVTLSELEKLKDPQTGDPFFYVRLSHVEERLTLMYQDKLAKVSDDDPNKLAMKTEQVQILDRIANLNRRLIRNRRLRLLPASIERSDAARKELKALSAKQQKSSDAQPERNGDVQNK